ncbi:patatin-like phospholipase family protein [Patescibacteria group bacterium]|nr:patatin-like phospholipase family protein [Patescibacteria group bacterium]
MDKVFAGKKVGLALGGGGARGMAHIGVIKALEAAAIPIHAVAGTSVGALVGGWYALHGEVDSLADVVLGIKKRDMISSLNFYLRRDGMLFKNPAIEETVKDKIKNKQLKDCVMPFAAVATDVKSGEKVIIESGSLYEAIQASSAVPFVFKPASVGGRLLMDGGFVDPIPADVVKSMGADFVIAVDVTRDWTDISGGLPGLMDIPKMVDKVMEAIEYQIARDQLGAADIILHPAVIPFSWLDFYRSEEIIEAGARETRRNISKICRKAGYPPMPKSTFAKFIDFLSRD